MYRRYFRDYLWVYIILIIWNYINCIVLVLCLILSLGTWHLYSVSSSVKNRGCLFSTFRKKVKPEWITGICDRLANFSILTHKRKKVGEKLNLFLN